MTIHLLVEGSSERALLDAWSPRLLRNELVRVYPHQGKGRLPRDVHARPDPHLRGLLDQLPAKLRGFASSLRAIDDHVVVLADADADDIDELTAAIVDVATTVAPRLSVTVRLAVEETEAFYLGDLAAVRKAFPHANMVKARKYEPDSICSTAELFGEIVGDGGINKVSWAEAMGPCLTTKAKESRSPSFRSLLDALLRLRSLPKKKQKARKTRRHPTRNTRDPGRRRGPK